MVLKKSGFGDSNTTTEVLRIALLFDCHSKLCRMTVETFEHRFLFFHAHRRRNLTRFPNLEVELHPSGYL